MHIIHIVPRTYIYIYIYIIYIHPKETPRNILCMTLYNKATKIEVTAGVNGVQGGGVPMLYTYTIHFERNYSELEGERERGP